MKKVTYIAILLFPMFIMAQSKTEVTEAFLQSFANAFNAHDVKLIMSHMTNDCVFEASAGPDLNGEKFTGQEQVKKTFENVFETFAEARWANARHFVFGN